MSQDRRIDQLSPLAAGSFASTAKFPAYASGTKYVAADVLAGGLARLHNVHVVTDPRYGAVGDGVTDDTDALQTAIDAAVSGGVGVVRGQPGHTYLVSSLDVMPGLVLDLNGATVKAKPNAANFTRLLTTQNNKHGGATDSDLLVICNGTLDGNRQNQGTYTGYEKEQNMLLFLTGDSAVAGRLTALVSNVRFKDSTSDGLFVYYNVAVQAVNCVSQDCFRGGFTATAGYSRVQIQNWQDVGTTHPFGINIEVDAPGYGGSYASDFQIDGWHGGTFDVGMQGGTIVGSNIVAGPSFTLSAKQTRAQFANSVFSVGVSSTTVNRIIKPHNVTFSNCEFIVTESAETVEAANTLYACRIYWNISSSTEANQTLRFVDCRWSVASDVEGADTIYAVYAEADTAGVAGNTLIVDGGEVSADYDMALRMAQGGNWKIRRVESKATTFLRWSYGASRAATIELDGVRVPSATTYMHIETHDAGNTITHRNVELDESVNVLATTSGIANNVYAGRRVILGASAPLTTTPGLKGDLYRLKVPVAGSTYEWVCTVSGVSSAVTWKALTSVAA